VALGTNAFPSLLRRTRLLTVPVYDYVLMTEPLSPAQRASIGWAGGEGVDDAANSFHYYRMTADGRILWGGYDAVYHFGRRVDPRYDQRPATHTLLSEQFFATFPQLEGLRFTHRWGGAIDTCTRFCAFYGTAHRGDVAYAAGYTGSASARPASRRRSCSTCWPARRPSARGWRWCAASPCRSRPSRSLTSASSSPAERCRKPTATTAAAAPGCAPSTGSGWASTPS
jgi:hypothetical protein